MKLDLIRLKQVKSTNEEAIKIIKSKKNKEGLWFLFLKPKEREQWEKNGYHLEETFLRQYFLN